MSSTALDFYLVRCGNMLLKNMRYFFSFLLFFSSHAFCQDKAVLDSLLKDVAAQRSDTGEIKTLSELCFFFANNDPAKSQQYANEEKLLADKVGLPKFSANALNDMAIAEYYSGNYTASLQHNKAALAIRESIGDKALLISSLNKLALIYQDIGKYDTAAAYQFRLLKLAEELKQETFIGITYGNLSFLFDKLKNYKLSESYARAALVIASKEEDKMQIARAYGNIAGALEHNNNYDSAIIYYNMSLPLFREENDLTALAAAYNDLGLVYRENKNNAAGIASYRKAYDLATGLKNTNDIAFYASNLANVLMEMHNYKEAFSLYSDAVKIATLSNNLTILKMGYSGLSSYYFLQNMPDSAFHYQSLYDGVSDSLYSGNVTKQIAEMQTAYETEKKEQQITLLNKENTIQKLSLSKNRIFLWSAAGLLLAGLAFAVLIYNRNKIKQDAVLQAEVMKQQEMATEAVIEAEENERKRIARDLHDGVGQMMSAAKMNMSIAGENIAAGSAEKIAFEKALALVDESCKEVRNVSHNMMPNALIRSGLASAVRAFIEQIESPFLKVQLYTEGLNESLNKNTETVLYRVLQECVNNVIKHSKASNLDIALIKDAAGINATIEDNGTGFDTSDKNKFSGIGLDNMQKRISFLKGTIEWQSSPGSGTLVAIYVPA